MGKGSSSGSLALELDGLPAPADEAGWLLDWGVLFASLICDVRAGRAVGEMAARFINSLAEAIVQVARRIGEEKVVLTGGCFQNALLLERTIDVLRSAGFAPYWHQRVPPNDGGIALGQVVAAARALQCGEDR